MEQPDRYHRQTLLPQIGVGGRDRLRASRVLLVGCGALGCHAADQLARAGVGHIKIVDRDVIELTNLQRQTLFTEREVGSAKAPAAAARLKEINSQIKIEAIVTDLWPGNIELLAENIDLILDGTDNVQTRYLLNDYSVKFNVPWIHAACVATEGRVMPIVPQQGPCLRCIFPDPPSAAELPTCDTAGILQPAAAAVASLQVAQALNILIHKTVRSSLHNLDIWSARFSSIELTEARNPNCPCCGKREFPFLELTHSDAATTLCGRNTVQIRPARPWIDGDFDRAITKLQTAGPVEQGGYFSRCHLAEPPGFTLTCFRDGRLLVHGTSDTGRAKAIYAKYLGA
jgi:molybdopterin/thiamine biosynthesis adenylyltransferase